MLSQKPHMTLDDAILHAQKNKEQVQAAIGRRRHSICIYASLNSFVFFFYAIATETRLIKWHSSFFIICSFANRFFSGHHLATMKWFKNSTDDNDSPRLLSLSPLRHCDQQQNAENADNDRNGDDGRLTHPRNTTPSRSSPGTRSLGGDHHKDGEHLFVDKWHNF